MNYSKYRISLDIHDTNSQAMLNVKKDDTARKFYFSLTDGGRPYQIAEEGCTAVFRAKKPDGTILYNDCTINDNVIEYTLTQQTSASVGIVDCEVTLYGSDSRQITSPRFVLVVEDNLYSDSEIESTDEFTALTEAVSEANNLNLSASKDGTVATLTVTKKDGTTQSVTISDGAKGVKGEKGDPGDIENIDQIYTPDSENAQSGKAVAEAFKRKTTTTPEQESAQFGDELVSATGWTTDGWTGDLATGFTHTSGNISSLIFDMPEDTDTNIYVISFKCSIDIASNALMVKCGNSELFDLYGQTANPLVLGIQSISNGNVEFVPASTFTGTISEISIKKVLNGFDGSYKLTDSKDLIAFEVRATKSEQNNLFVGKNSGKQNISGYGCVGSGVNALQNNTSGFWNAGIGFNALQNNTVGSRNIGVGYIALQSNTVGSRNIGIGSFALHSNTTGDRNIAIGADNMDKNITGSNNVSIGFQAMYYGTEQIENVAIGSESLKNITNAQNNVAIGKKAGYGITTGNYNLAIGAETLAHGENGIGNTAIGYGSGGGLNGNYNIAIGYNSLGSNTTSTSKKNNVSIGCFSGQTMTAGNNNLLLGYGAGKAMTTGSSNVCIGANVGENITTGTANILIGFGASASSDTGNYQFSIGYLLKGSHHPTQTNRYLTVDGALRIAYLTTTDPHIAGQLWNDNGTLKVSAG